MSGVAFGTLKPGTDAPALEGALAVGPQPLPGGATLQSLAAETLEDAGWGLASPLECLDALEAAASEAFPGTAAPEALAASWLPTVREAMRQGADWKALQAWPEARIARLGRLGGAYADALSAHQLCDPAEALRWASQLGPEPRRLDVRGYARLGADERAWIEALAAPGSRVLTLDPDWDALADACAVEAHTVLDAEAQARFALGLAAARREAGGSLEGLALVARDDAQAWPLLSAIAAEYDLPLAAYFAVPLAETRLGGWLAALAGSLRAPGAYQPRLRLLAHPLSRPAWERDWPRWRVLRPDDEPAWEEAGGGLPALAAWPERAPYAAHHRQLQAVMETLGAEPRTPEDTAAWKAFSTLAQRRTAGAETISRASFTAGLERALAVLPVNALRGQEGGVALHTPLALYGKAYAHLVVLGAVEGELPRQVQNPTTLDDFAREALAEAGGPALERAAASAAREADSVLMGLSAAAGGRLTLLAPGRGADGRLRHPGAIARRLGATWRPAPAQPPRSAEEERIAEPAHLPPAARRALEAARAAEAGVFVPEHEGVTGKPVVPGVFSASQLTVLGQCPFRWFIERVLKVYPPLETPDGIPANARGSLLHAVLELGMRAHAGAPDPREAILADLEALFDEAEREIGWAPYPHYRSVHRPRWARQLEAVVRHPDFWLEGAELVGTEVAFRTEWNGLTIMGSIDRVDRLPDGSLLLTDYKSGARKPAGALDEKYEAKREIQMPLYAEIASFPGAIPALGPAPVVSGARFLSLATGKALEASIAPLAPAYVSELLAPLRTGSFPLRPGKQAASCTYCPHDAVCRRGARHEPGGDA